MKKQIKLDELIKLTKNNTKFNKLLEFLNINHSFVEEFRKDYYQNKITGESAKVKVRKIFIDAMNASGGNNLSSTGIACEKFYQIIDKLPNDNNLNFSVFINEFNEICNKELETIEDLYLLLAESKEFPNIKYKKAAIFLRNIFWLQSNDSENKIFTNIIFNNNTLKVPVDIVITTILNIVLLESEENKLKADRDFNLINEFALKILKENFMIFEDLWFWGFFNTINKKENNKTVRKIEFNKDKYYSSNFIYPSETLEKKFKEFKSIILNN